MPRVVDSHRKGLDDDRYLQRYSPRRPGSSWSRVDVEKVEALVAAGRVRAGGFAAIAAARADGRWDAAHQRQRDATVPPDPVEAPAGADRARERFERLDRTRRHALLLRLVTARTPAARAARLSRIADDLAGVNAVHSGPHVVAGWVDGGRVASAHPASRCPRWWRT
ncbi:YdeI/OmpD-associated family protein [Saccharothrix sp. 6-C]|uniref:YdeI/OmpD-associated family protein n=1 Tax=Saccharothrix sp. 6-C TaxID=2781735 RepID=UPI001916EAE2|nr:YdeI/OmpD-associated family protein [Saccharothrix sp. 6-C]